MAHALESNFAVCTPPSRLHVANWIDAYQAMLAAAPAAPPAVDLEKVEEALEWIAGMAEVRAADDKQVFTRVNRGALRNIASRARSVLSDIRKARE